MNKLTYQILLSFVLLTIRSYGQSDKAPVQDALSEFRTALQSKNYSKSLSYIDSATISFYDTLLPLVKYADSINLASAPLITRLMVLTFRHYDSAQEIRTFNGKQLLEFALKKQMVSYSSMVGDSIHLIDVQNGSATVVTISESNNDTIKTTMLKEKNKWRINFLNQLSYAETILRRLIQESGKQEDDYLFALLENITGTRPRSAIWDRR